MRVLLDECLPRKLAGEFPGHTVSTVPQQGWAGLSNGKLLAQIGTNFDVFVTIDKNLPAQQTLTSLPFGVVVIRAPSNRIVALRPLVPQIAAALGTVSPGKTVIIG